MTERAFQVGAWLTPQHTTTDRLRTAWRAADDLGVDSLWLWDHFFPLTGDPDGGHLEAWTLLGAMAVETRAARIGPLVSNHEFRNPDLLADMARTVDCLSGGRLVLGLGAGWFERDYEEYGYPFRTGPERAKGLVEAVTRIKARLKKLTPTPSGPLPLLIGGDGQRVILRLAAEQADHWNTMAWRFVEGSHHLNLWCEKVGRDPRSIRRSCFITTREHLPLLDDVVAAGADEVIVQVQDPFDLSLVRDLISRAETRS